MYEDTIHLLITCPDRRGIIAAVSGFVAQYDGNMLEVDEHVETEHGEFFMRVAIGQDGFRLGPADFDAAWRPLAEQYAMRWQIRWGGAARRMAILVSKQSHCLADMLWRHQFGEWRVEIPLVISNHDDLRDMVERGGIAFHHLAVTPVTRAQQESQALALLLYADVDFVVLARYMQILSGGFVGQFPNRIINIHHSFLPAFSGAQPYRQAFERGVKTIGATAHYVTEQLDEGPIIAQQTLPVDHRDGVQDLIRKGRDMERGVLATAVRLHIEDRILTSRNKTIVFG